MGTSSEVIRIDLTKTALSQPAPNANGSTMPSIAEASPPSSPATAIPVPVEGGTPQEARPPRVPAGTGEITEDGKDEPIGSSPS